MGWDWKVHLWVLDTRFALGRWMYLTNRCFSLIPFSLLKIIPYCSRGRDPGRNTLKQYVIGPGRVADVFTAPFLLSVPNFLFSLTCIEDCCNPYISLPIESPVPICRKQPKPRRTPRNRTATLSVREARTQPSSRLPPPRKRYPHLPTKTLILPPPQDTMPPPEKIVIHCQTLRLPPHLMTTATTSFT